MRAETEGAPSSARTATLHALGGPPLPLGFVQEGTTVYLVARERTAQWPTQILREGMVSLQLTAGSVRGRPTLITEPGYRERILTLFLEKYGVDQYTRWYAHPARVVAVDCGIIVEPGLSEEQNYVNWLTAEFDNVAADYDRHILGNRINRLLRDRSLAVLKPLFRGAPLLLEIGCGSGMETLPLLREGHELVVVDLSQQMLEVVKHKARRDGLGERLRTYRLRAAEIGRLENELGEERFQGGYSTYGALNCEPDLRPVPAALHTLLRSKSYFVAGVYNRWCLFEMLAYGLTGRLGRALGRSRNPIPVGVSRFCVDVYAHGVRDFDRLFTPAFRRVGLQGVPVFLPPSDLTAYAEKFSSHFNQLASWDAIVGGWWPWSWVGDHFLAVYQHG